jgi:L-ascorbate metabolism protein UlaG (beta-lactamase superfamily)
MIILAVLLSVVLFAVLFVVFHPVFGGKPSKRQIETFEKLNHYSEGTFTNQIPTSMETDLRSMLPVLKEFFKGSPNRKPKTAIPVKTMNLAAETSNEQTRITWFGHSAVLLEMDQKKILIDPMFGRSPSPVPLFGSNRYSKDLPFRIEELPSIDLVILSHDHYDHLDYGSIRKLKDKVSRFVVPLGVGGHLERWEVDKAKITECDWWEGVDSDGLSLVCTPARHFSGRGLTDRNSTLWCSWCIKGKESTLFFSGDSGYGPHFKEIGEKYGPFDLTLMECGQYHEKWSAIHMVPEETVQAHLDVRGKVMIPIHWGAFTLSLHDWTEPVERAIKAAKNHNVAISTPQIGETVNVQAADFPELAWWR